MAGRIEWERMTSGDVVFQIQDLQKREAAVRERLEEIERLVPYLGEQLRPFQPAAGEKAIDVIVAQYLYGAPVLPLWQPLTPPHDGKRRTG